MIQLATGMAAFTAVAMLLGLIAGAFVFVVEEIGRAPLNRSFLSSWARYCNGRAERIDRLSRRWYSLPYKQMTGAISATLQVGLSDPHPPIPSQHAEKDPAASSLRDELAMIGASILGISDFKVGDRPKGDDGEAAVVTELTLADRALDDLQTQLALNWTRARLLAAGSVIFLVFAVVYAQRDEAASLGFFGSLVTFPVIWFAAVIFATIFRDLIERLTGDQR